MKLIVAVRLPTHTIPSLLASSNINSTAQIRKPSLSSPTQALPPTQTDGIWNDINQTLQDTPNEEGKIDAIISLAIERSRSYVPRPETPVDFLEVFTPLEILTPSSTTTSLSSTNKSSTPDWFSDTHSHHSSILSNTPLTTSPQPKKSRWHSSRLKSVLTLSRSEILTASSTGDLSQLKKYLPRVDPLTQFEALISAIQSTRFSSPKKRIDVVAHIIDNTSISLDSRDSFHKRTPLITAICARQPGTAAYLLSRGANPDERDGAWPDREHE